MANEKKESFLEVECSQCKGIAEMVYDVGHFNRATTCYECGWVVEEQLSGWNVVREFQDPKFSKVRMKVR